MVCPEDIHITDNGIIPLKERVVDRKYDPVFITLGIGKRKDRKPVGPAAGTGPSPIKRPGAPSPAPVRTGAIAALTGTRASAAANGETARPRVFGPSIPMPVEQAKMALPAVGAAAGIGFLAWAIRKARKK